MVFQFIMNQYEKSDVQDVDSKFTLINGGGGGRNATPTVKHQSKGLQKGGETFCRVVDQFPQKQGIL